MSKKEFDKQRRQRDKALMGMDLEDFKRAVLRRIGELEVRMFYVGHFVGTDYEAVRRSRKWVSKMRGEHAEFVAKMQQWGVTA